MIKLFSSILLGFWENPKLGSAIANKLMNSRVLLVLLIILRSSVLLSQAPTRIAWFNLLKSVWLSLSSQPRRAFYSTSSTCQALFRKFLSTSVTCRFALSTSLQRGAHSTANPVTVKRDLENFFLFQLLAASAYLGTHQRGAHSTDTNSPVNPLQRKRRRFSVTSI